MVKIHCDICGKEMTVWYNVKSKPRAGFSFLNYNRVDKSIGMEVCEKCYDKLMVKLDVLKEEALNEK